MKKGMFLVMLLAMVLQTSGQQVALNKQRQFSRTVPAGNYSGIAWLGGDRYAVVDDKSPTAGFHLMTISTDAAKGTIKSVRDEGFMTSGQPNRDEEGVCYVPQTNTLFVCGEGDGQIVEYGMDGRLTGRRLAVPSVFDAAYDGSGFEALTYNAKTHRFWTTTENTIKIDGEKPDISRKLPNVLRFQSFDDDLQPAAQYWYMTDTSAVVGTEGKSTLGVSGMAALDNGNLIVLEREVRQTSNNIGSYVQVKLYVVNPSLQQPGDLLQKQLLTEFRTSINLTRRSFANYEGICVGPRLADGRQVLLLVADSQNQYKGVLNDWFKTIVIPDVQFIPTPSAPANISAFLAPAIESYGKGGKKKESFLSPQELPDHLRYLPAPPEPGTFAFQNDVNYHEWGKSQRLTPRAYQAALDEVQSTANSFCGAAGFVIGPDECPEIFRLTEGAYRDAGAANRKAKDYYHRTRPFVRFNESSLVSDHDASNAKTYSYPSGHSVRGWVYALTLALVVPDSTEALIRRAQEFALNRVVCGRHWKSDTEASLIEATAVMSRLLSNKDFQEQLAKAREEYARIRTRK